MKARIYAICRIIPGLTTILFLAALITGGADLSFATERNIYEVTAINNASQITTVFRVFADTERDARENVSLNGWSIVSMRQITYRQTTAVPVQTGDGPVADTVTLPQYYPDNTTAGAAAEDNITPRLSDDELIDSLLGEPVPNASLGRGGMPPIRDGTGTAGMPPIRGGTGTAGMPPMRGGTGTAGMPPMRDGTGTAEMVPMRGDVDILSMTPDSEELEYIYTIYFDFSIITPSMNAADNATLSRLPKDGTYYMFGHADNVSVTPNQLFKDNYELSFKRAEVVKELMTANGINPAKLITVGLGALYPAVENRSSADGTLENRRVEIYGLRTAK